jgi:flavin reductase (DIM6/NTAB) family NADH-FMN oxidoreductase RutF
MGASAMSRWLPTALKQKLRALPQWSAIALREPQAAVEVRMFAAGGNFDVTRNSVVAALRPLTLAVGLGEQIISTMKEGSEPALHFVDLESRHTLGVQHLRQIRDPSLAASQIGLFEIRHGAQYCVRWPYRPWNRWLQNRAMRKHSDPNNFSMPPAAVQQLMIFYIRPRPVVLVSVDDGHHSNIFPMDLIGHIAPDYFTLALRSTSQSIATMKTARRVALSSIAAQDRAIAYQLGAHHKNVQVEWDRLPFRIQRSNNYALPCPETALGIRELDILSFESIGSHTFFITRIASERSFRDSPQLCHTSGIHQYFRSRNGGVLQLAP